MARNMRFCHFLQKRYGRTDGWTDGRTDTASYRDARTHLKILFSLFLLSQARLPVWKVAHPNLPPAAKGHIHQLSPIHAYAKAVQESVKNKHLMRYTVDLSNVIKCLKRTNT